MITITGGNEWKNIIGKLRQQGLGVKFGVLENSTNAKGKPVAEYAFYNEFGTVKKVMSEDGKSIELVRIPARPFMRFTVAEKKKDWAKGLTTLLIGSLFKGNPQANMRKALGKFGMVAKQDIQKTIRKNNFEPNAASTLKKKGGKPPLIDTKDMLNSIDYEVVQTVKLF